MYLYSIVLLLFAVLLEGSVTTLPVTLVVLVLLYCLFKEDLVFLLATVSGVILDVLLVRSVGGSSMFYLFVLFLLFLYQRKFEIDSYYFVFFALFISLCIYLYFFSFSLSISGLIFTTFLGTSVFLLLQKVVSQKERKKNFR